MTNTAASTTFLLVLAVGGQPPDRPAAEIVTSADQAAESARAAAAEVQRFEFFLADGSQAKLKLHETPVLRYTNPLRGDVHSDFYVWTHEGRPEIVASLSNWYSPRPYVGLAATSLSTGRLVGKRDGQEIWRPRGAGLEFQSVPDAEPPADTAAKRLRQMTALARRFSAEFKREARYNEGGPLRLLTKPLFRYEAPQGDVQDGALFAMADGTSPQLNLLIESRKSNAGFQWQFALAPNNSVEYRVSLDNRQVWRLPQRAPPWPNSKDPLNTYTVFPDLQVDGRSDELAAQLAKAIEAKPE
jgi:hypothetical protein